jgi:hypothetical protein
MQREDPTWRYEYTKLWYYASDDNKATLRRYLMDDQLRDLRRVYIYRGAPWDGVRDELYTLLRKITRSPIHADVWTALEQTWRAAGKWLVWTEDTERWSRERKPKTPKTPPPLAPAARATRPRRRAPKRRRRR